MTIYSKKATVIKKIVTQCSHTKRPCFALRPILGQQVLFGWTPWKNILIRLVFRGDWRPLAFLTFNSEGRPFMSFCNKEHLPSNYPSEFESQNNLFPELKVEDLVIKNMTFDQETLFHRLFFFYKS